jgi:hypothetical protein
MGVVEMAPSKVVLIISSLVALQAWGRPKAECKVVDRLLSQEVLVPGRKILEDFYASSVMIHPKTKRLTIWFGGWRGKQDFPFDKLFMATMEKDQQWMFHDQPLINFGGAMNDPAIIYQKTRDRYFLFFTYQRDPALWHGLPGNHHLDGDENYLQVWVAESDDGINWKNPVQVIGRHNGYDATGAWAASVLLEDDDTVSLFYHNGPNFKAHPNDRFYIFRSRIDISGNPKLVETHPIKIQRQTTHVMGNVNVVRHRGRLVMTYNEMIPGPPPLNLRFRSAVAQSDDNGENWQEISAEPFRPPGSENLDIAKPTLYFPPKYPQEAWLFVGEGNQSILQSGISLWRYSLCE